MEKLAQILMNVWKSPEYVPNIVQILPEVTTVSVMSATTKGRMMNIPANVKTIHQLGSYSPINIMSEIYH